MFVIRGLCAKFLVNEKFKVTDIKAALSTREGYRKLSHQKNLKKAYCLEIYVSWFKRLIKVVYHEIEHLNI